MQRNSPHVSLPQVCAPREDLIRTFNTCSQKQFIFIQAPAGYGKTISTLLWLKRTRRTFAWLFLDKYDNVLSLFYRSLCRTLLETVQESRNDAFPGISDESRYDAILQFLNSPSFSAAPVENAMEFISMLPLRDDQCALVLDDLHNIVDEEILRSLPYVLKRLPPFMNVLLLSRMEMPDPMNILTENNKAGFIGRSELTFTPEEIRNHFIHYGWFISLDRANDIFSFTEGWIIILNAMVLHGDQKIFQEEYKLTLQEYFERNIWSGFDEPTKNFLMKTSVVDSFTPELCELLTESHHCAETLDMLIRGNINLSRMGQEYRYHHLFLEFLREQVQKSVIDQADLFSVAARYYLDSQQFFRAAICSMRSNDAQLKMQVVQSFFTSKNPALEQFLELSRVYDTKMLTKEMFDRNPVLYMPNILAAFLRGNTERTAHLFDRLYASLPSFSEANHPFVGVLPTRLLLDFRIGLSDLLSFMESKGIKWGAKFPGQAAVITVQMPMLHRSVRDYHEFLDEETKEAVREVFSCILPGDSESFYMSVEAGLLMEQNRTGEALELALTAYNGMTEDTAVEVHFGVCVCLSEIYIVRSESERSRNVLARLHQWLDDNNALYLLKNLTAYKERQHLLDGDRVAAQRWLDNYFINDSAFGEFYKIYQNFTTVRALIILSEIPKAQSALAVMKELAEAMDRPLDAAEADVLTAILEWATGKKKVATSRLYEVLTKLQPYGFVRVVANEGRAVLPIITAIVKKMDRETEKDKVFYRFVKEIQLAAYEQARRFKSITHDLTLEVIKLSPRQTLVLDLLSKGHKNAEIIEITGLSLNTIREHTRVAYRKLEVTNAMDAVIRAKHLGLLK